VLARGRRARPPAGAVFTVTKTDDTNDGSCDATRYARRSSPRTARAAWTRSSCVGRLLADHPGANEDLAATGDLDVRESAVVSATGALVDAGLIDRVFQIFSGSAVTMTGIAVERGSATPGGNLWVMASAALRLEDVTVGRSWSGSGIYNGGELR
jgi:hypothetical protein